MTPNLPTPTKYYCHRRKAWRESRRTAYIRTMHRYLLPDAAAIRITRMVQRINNWHPLCPKE